MDKTKRYRRRRRKPKTEETDTNYTNEKEYPPLTENNTKTYASSVSSKNWANIPKINLLQSERMKDMGSDVVRGKYVLKSDVNEMTFLKETVLPKTMTIFSKAIQGGMELELYPSV